MRGLRWRGRAVNDNHHSPMKPSQYIAARLVPMLDYYQTRVPRKDRERTLTVMTLVITTGAIAVSASCAAAQDCPVAAELQPACVRAGVVVSQ